VEYPIVTEELNVTGSGSPTAIASAAQGANALTVNFSGSGSDNGTIDLYEWDFENDGIFDYSSPTSGVVSHAYAAAGVKVAAFRVTDNDSNTSVDRVRIETFAPATLEVLDDTIEPLLAEANTVRTTTTIESVVWLYIKAADQILSTGEIVEGRIIRTLVDHVTRPAGTYNDTWDGLDERFELTHPGAYYAVLEYSYPGRTDRLDLTNTTGNVHYFAPRLTPNPTSLNPFEDDFWDMTFEITSASRASLYILPGGSNRTDTPFDNLPLGAGLHSYFWAGLTAEGQIAPSINHLWSVNAWTLGDNAIVTTIRPEVDALDIEPNMYSPTDRPTSEALLTVNYECTRPAAVLAKVIRIDNGNTLRAIQTDFLPAGAQSFEWDGRAENGKRVSPGDYSFAVEVVDEFGNISIRRYGLCRVIY
jgi:flagellar hook assembly protein FlgD